MCLQLYKSYEDVYHDTKNKIAESEEETNLECSEMFVFGKFKTFRTRLEKVMRSVVMYEIKKNLFYIFWCVCGGLIDHNFICYFCATKLIYFFNNISAKRCFDNGSSVFNSREF